MDLREFLSSAASVKDLSSAAAGSATKLRQDIEQEDLANNLQAFIANRDLGGIASGAMRSGDNKPLDTITAAMAQNMMPKPSSTSGSALTRDQLPDWLPEEDKDRIAGIKDRKGQEFQIAAFQKKEAETRQQGDAERRKVTYATGQKEKFGVKFDKVENQLRDEERQISKVGEALKSGQTPSDAVVFNFLARAVAGEKGPLSEGDVARFINKTFAGNVEKFKNFVKGESVSILTDEQRQAYNDLVQIAVDNFSKYKDERLGVVLAGGLADHPTLSRNGELDESFKIRMERHNFERGPDGKVVKKGLKAPQIEGDAAEIFKTMSSRVKNPQAKEALTKALIAWSGKPMDEATKAKFNARIDQYSKVQ